MKKLYFLCSILLLSACGTLFSGTTQKITFDSNVKDVKVFIDGMEECVAPCQISIERSSDAVLITGRKKGYKDRVITLRSSVNRTSYWNLIGIYSWSTDAVSGGVWRYRNDAIYLNMEPDEVSPSHQRAEAIKTRIRHFVLFNYPDLNMEASQGNAGEHILALQDLSGLEGNVLIDKIKQSENEVDCAAAIANDYH